MYINNNRLIDNLVNSNNEIRVLIQNILQQNLQQNRNNSANIYNINRTNRATRQSETSDYNYVFNEPLYTENTSFVIDYIQPTQFSRLLQTFLDPIDVYPTQEQIDNATSIIRYGDIETPLNNSCPISLEPFQENENVTMIRHCGHIFKQEQLLSWFQTNVRCPVCRYDIRNYIPPSSSSMQNNRNTATNVGTQEETTPVTNRNRNRRNLFRPSLQRETPLTNLNNRIDQFVSTLLTNGFAIDASFNQFI